MFLASELNVGMRHQQGMNTPCLGEAPRILDKSRTASVPHLCRQALCGSGMLICATCCHEPEALNAPHHNPNRTRNRTGKSRDRTQLNL